LLLQQGPSSQVQFMENYIINGRQLKSANRDSVLLTMT